MTYCSNILDGLEPCKSPDPNIKAWKKTYGKSLSRSQSAHLNFYLKNKFELRSISVEVSFKYDEDGKSHTTTFVFTGLNNKNEISFRH